MSRQKLENLLYLRSGDIWVFGVGNGDVGALTCGKVSCLICRVSSFRQPPRPKVTMAATATIQTNVLN